MTTYVNINFFTAGTSRSHRSREWGILPSVDQKAIVCEPVSYYVDATNQSHNSFDSLSCVVCQMGEPIKAMEEAVQNLIRGL